ncbi:glycosyltransferase family 4 protein [Aeromonas dhakensis]|uniref:glycosyltransferase family 4 protein n=1 Tax=Aeromonas dhakensis TaxID=196024 RepID=UPI00244BED61|nr:glycosyltransferase family 4 protein [Aeromonas dhakensis]MDH0347681.1 glycosyltransferase family 4 protein [Aeromonas dhakensis]
MTKKLLFLVNVDWFFISHRLPIALAAQKEGYEVHIACSFTEKYDFLLQLGFKLHPLELSRTGTKLMYEMVSCINIFKVLRTIKPDLVHLVTIKPVLYGGISCRLLGVRNCVASISGLGYVFIATGVKATLMKAGISALYKLALKGKHTKVIFQNADDMKHLININAISSQQAVMIRGSGVDLASFSVVAEPEGIPVIMLMARLLIDKGVVEFVEAARILKYQSVKCRFVLVGSTDENPKSVSSTLLNTWVNEGVVEYWGYSDNPAETYGKANVVVLPSYREGLPKSLIEAAACGRAVITTDVPGCRDAILPNVTGILVPAKDSKSLAVAISTLCENSQLRKRLGSAGRKLAEDAFDIKSVINTHISIYERLLG